MVTRDVLVGVGIGAAVAFVADPQSGRRRRAVAEDKLIRAGRKTRDAMATTARDLANRSAGVMAATRGRFAREPMDDARLIERVRAKLGRASSHPRAIDVEAANGLVTLRGPVLAAEITGVLATVRAVRGVHDVVNALEPHETSAGIPALQGQGRVAGRSIDILQNNWAPATRALVAAAGVLATGLVISAIARR